MGALTAELQFSFCQAQLASTAGDCSSSKSRNGQNCSAVGFSSISRGLRSSRLDNHRLLALSSGLRWLPLTEAQGWKWSGRERGLNGERGREGGISGGEVGPRARRSATVRMATGQLNSPKPTFVPLEMITGEENLDKILSEALERNQPVVIDWLAAWCRKCIYLKPKLEKLAAEYYPHIKFYYIDVNTVPQALVKRAEVTKMPTIQLWKNGERLAEVIGGHQAWLVLEEVREMINKKR